jgi:DNA-binding transcriptional LysR family regulator
VEDVGLTESMPPWCRDVTADVGFTRGIPHEFRKVLGSEVLFREPLLAVLPREHALANEPTIRIAQLAADRFVLYAREGAPDMFDTIVACVRKRNFIHGSLPTLTFGNQFSRWLRRAREWHSSLRAFKNSITKDYSSTHCKIEVPLWTWYWRGAAMNQVPFAMPSSISCAKIDPR